MTPFRTLYIDMNSFFASVEQQVDPSLRGRPLAITAVSASTGAVVAASYEAKAFGIGVGTRIHEARRKCPGIVFRPSRHRLYVRINQKIAAVLDEMGELGLAPISFWPRSPASWKSPTGCNGSPLKTCPRASRISNLTICRASLKASGGDCITR